MGYSIYITRGTGKNAKEVEFPEAHFLHGGTYCPAGTKRAYLSETYNYAPTFCEVLGGNGIRDFDGRPIKDTIPLLDSAIYQLKDAQPSNDYWAKTPGNAKAALFRMKILAETALYYYPNVKTLCWAIS